MGIDLEHGYRAETKSPAAKSTVTKGKPWHSEFSNVTEDGERQEVKRSKGGTESFMPEDTKGDGW